MFFPLVFSFNSLAAHSKMFHCHCYRTFTKTPMYLLVILNTLILKQKTADTRIQWQNCSNMHSGEVAKIQDSGCWKRHHEEEQSHLRYSYKSFIWHGSIKEVEEISIQHHQTTLIWCFHDSLLKSWKDVLFLCFRLSIFTLFNDWDLDFYSGEWRVCLDFRGT